MPTSSSIPFHVWIAALSAGYTPLEAMVTWADQRIMGDAYQARWILDLSLSTTLQEAVGVLGLEWSRQSESPANGVIPLQEPGNLHLGFLYLRFAEQRLTMAELLENAGMYVDGQGYDRVAPSCEEFFYLLNEIEGSGPTHPGNGSLTQRIEKLFAPFANAARAVLSELPVDPGQLK